jgi:transcriptional regulator with XRE-family HTH domain
MGRASRPRPQRLASKLLQIRTTLGLSQNGLINRLGFGEELTQDYISAYERGIREPPLPVLLQYARMSNVLVEVLDLLRKSESSKISTAKLLTFTPGQTDFRKRSID